MKRWIVGIAVLVVLGGVGNACGVVQYTVTDLGSLGGYNSYWRSEAEGINASGQVVGFGGGGFRTAPNSAINPATDNLGTLGPGGFVFASGINDSGQVVGYSGNQAFRTAPNSAINPATDDLGTLGGSFSMASAINDSGQVVGYSLNSDGAPHAFVYSGSSPMIDLGTLVSGESKATGINNSGQVAGYFTSGQNYHAFRTAPNSSINPATDDLGRLGGRFSMAYGINDSGQVVGASWTGSQQLPTHAFLYSGSGPMIDLGTLGGGDFSEALGINASGQVVGDSNGLAFLYSGSGPMQDLNDLIPPGLWTLSKAVAINDRGQIVGGGMIGGAYEAFLLTPVPELYILGDANGDNLVDDKDASILGAHWHQHGDAAWADGDFNGDGNVNDADAAILAAHWGEGVGDESVPEPGSLALLAGIAMMGMVYLRRWNA